LAKYVCYYRVYRTDLSDSASTDPGDTMYPMLEIVELVPQRTTGVIVMRATLHNQKGELVLEGTHKLLVKKRPA